MSFVCVSLFSIGCAQEVGDIDRVQANALLKSDFDPGKEYYYRQQITDTDLQGSFAFQGLYGDLKRVRWEITEDWLLACNTVPAVQGARAEREFAEGKECHSVVAAFPILGHFDIQRDYNAATGEQFNTLNENASDRLWYERDYFRVDWSGNVIDYSVSFGDFTYRFQPADYSTLSSASWNPNQDPGYADPMRTRIQPEEGYFETTTVFHTNPDYNACFYLSGQAWVNCDGGRIAVTHSFAEVPEEKTFEPFFMRDNELVLKDDGVRPINVRRTVDSGAGAWVQVECTEEVNQRVFEERGELGGRACEPLTFDYFGRFGYFRTENHVFDDNYELVDSGRQYYANHHNIWQTAYDEDENLIPAKDRTPKPIVYYLNAEYPQDLIAGAKEVERQWDLAFLETVMIAKGYSSLDEVRDELEEEYGDRRMFKIVENGCMPSRLSAWAKEHGSEDDLAMINDFITSDSTVKDGSREEMLWGLPIGSKRQLCANLEYVTEDRPVGERFIWEREGDVRKNFFSYVEEENDGWLGYGPSSGDPLTGEIISGSAHMAGAAIRTSAATAADIIRYLNGELDEQDLAAGTHIRQYSADLERQNRETLSQGLTPEGKRKFAQRSPGAKAISPTQFERAPSLDQLPDFVLNRSTNELRNWGLTMSKAAVASQQADTRFADFVSMPEVKRLMLADPRMTETLEAMAREIAQGRDVTDDDLQIAYLNLNTPQINQWRQKERKNLFRSQSILTAEDHLQAIDSLVTYSGVADRFKGQSRDEIADYFLQKMFVGTQLHEVGHTVGLRHNFESSMDALNYHDEFWEIRRAVLEGRISEDQASSIPLETAQEFLTPEQLKEDGISYLNETEFRLGSVMDYTGDMTGRFAGLGKYDHAAVNFVYGRHVQTWKPEVLATLPESFDNRLFLASYKELPDLLSGMDPKVETDQTKRELAGIDNILNGRQWTPIDKAINDLRKSIEENTSKFENKQFNFDNMPTQVATVPYRFCSDDRSDFQLGCDVFDWGSSHREIVNHYFNTYRILQPFYRYRRGRINANVAGRYANFLARTLFASARAFRFFSFYRFWDLGSYTDDLREAAIDSVNFYGEVLSIPEPGTYCLFDQDDDDLRWSTNWQYSVQNAYLPAAASYSQGECDDRMTIEEGVGQYYNYDISDEYKLRINYVGTFVDKILASQLLFFISANNLYNQFITDQRATNISYWTLFKDEMHGLIRGMLLNDYTEFGGVYRNTQGTQGNYEPPNMVDRNEFTYGVPAKQEGLPRVYSPISFNHELNMLAYAMFTNSTWQDREVDFAQYVRIGVGDREVQDFAGSEIVEFVNPATNQIYVAAQMPDGKSISVDMLEWANQLKDRWMNAVDDVEQQRNQYDKLREAYTSDFNPNVCGINQYDLDNNVVLSAAEKEEIEGQLNNIANADLQAVCYSLVDFKQSTAIEQTTSDQLQNVVAQLDMLRWVREWAGAQY